MEAGQPAQLTGTNRSIGFSAAPSGKNHDRWHGSATEATGEASASPRAQGGSPPRQETRTQFASAHEVPGHARGSRSPNGSLRSPGLPAVLAGLVAIARGKTPDPIPNSAVKTLCADGTAAQAAEE